MEITNKIDYWLERASSSVFNQGLQWYPSTKEWTENIANQYGLHQKQVTGILSALSVMKEFSYNQRLVIEFLECQNCRHLSQQVIKCQHLYRLKDKLYWITDEHIMNILSGRKTQSFFENICYPNESTKLTVDFRMWKYFKKNEWVHITDKRWDEMEKVFQQKAKEMNISVPSLQAILWLTIKQNKNVT